MKSLPPALRAAIAERRRIVVMAYIDVPSAPLRVWSGIGTLRHDGHEWFGIGALGGISGVGGAKNLAVRTVTFSLRGVPSEARPYLELNLRNRLARAWIAAVKRRRLVVDGDPWLMVDGTCDNPTLSIGGDGKSMVKLSINEPIFQLERPLDLAWTSEWFKSRYGSNISGADMIPELVSSDVSWTRT